MAKKTNNTKEMLMAAVNTPAEKTTKKPAAKKEKKVNSKKVTVSVDQLTNEELRKVFTENGCRAESNANASTVVYNQFGTKSRVLQQKRAYQLLLTNGHKKVKETVVDSDNDDTARFIEFYNSLSEEDKKSVIGFDGIQSTKLSDSEMPRERTVKLTSLDMLKKFIQYMAQFEENKVMA